ncbi:MAG: DUF3592 domain-containing protein [Bacteroidetes bacterium]|nr:DUF3592 domain-containing protein [Bacteroidota bacterium]
MEGNYLLSSICLLLAFFFYYRRVKKYNQAIALSSLPDTIGKIIQVEIFIKDHEEEDLNGMQTTYHSYHPKITYSYQINNIEYTNDRYSTLAEPSFDNKEDADSFTAKYELNSSVSVFYDPKDPKTSFLNKQLKEKKIDAGTWTSVVVLVILSIAFLFL